jgi:hypothetical protein
VPLHKKENLEEFNMGIPKRKNMINVYGKKDTYQGEHVGKRRQELLDMITKSDSFLPDSILHDDLDKGMLDYVKKTFMVVSDGTQIPIIEKILTIQRWGEFTANWEFSDGDGNVKLPFIAIIRKPDVQFGTNPSIQRTIPERHQFHYATVPTWDGTAMGADIYKIPQPIPCDITYDITIVCNKFRDLNKFNKIVLQHFTSRQAYTKVKGHYIPIILNSIEDNTPMETMDGRRFYMQTYKFIMLGFLIDSDEFEVKPAISRSFLVNESLGGATFKKRYIAKTIDVVISTIVAGENQTIFTVGESINVLFNVSINGIVQEKNVHYRHLGGTSNIIFDLAGTPSMGDVVTVNYYKGKNDKMYDQFGNELQVGRETFTYNGNDLSFTLSQKINTVISIATNGLIEFEEENYQLTDKNEVTLTGAPVNGSRIDFVYLY